ncbi:MAG: hypothetical protein Q9M37_00895 [Desulfonauticus sp.]|nr:hypothetical protein [Desulfonauticus sp.]
MKTNNNSGFALISTLILGLIAMGFVAALFLMLNSTAYFSTNQKIYTSALEVSKGVKNYIITKLLNNDLRCKDHDICSNNDPVDINWDVPGYEIEATLISKYKNIKEDYTIYLFNVKISKNNSEDKVDVDFIYRLNW